MSDIPEDAIAWKKRGDEYISDGKYEEAIQCYQYAIHLDPDYTPAWNNLGYAFIKTGRIEEAKQVKEKIKEIKIRETNKNLKIPPKTNSSANFKKYAIFFGIFIVIVIIIGAGFNMVIHSPSSNTENTPIPTSEVPVVYTTFKSTPAPTQTPIPKSDLSDYYSDDLKLLDLLDWETDNSRSDNFDIAVEALINREYRTAIKYSEYAKNDAIRQLTDVKRLSVTREFQTVKSLFIDYLEYKKSSCDGIRESAQYLDDGLISRGIQRMDDVTQDLESMTSKMEDITMYLGFL